MPPRLVSALADKVSGVRIGTPEVRRARAVPNFPEKKAQRQASRGDGGESGLAARRALERGYTGALLLAAHGLEGGSGILGARRIARISERIEPSADSGNPNTAFGRILEGEFERVYAELCASLAGAVDNRFWRAFCKQQSASS